MAYTNSTIWRALGWVHLRNEIPQRRAIRCEFEHVGPTLLNKSLGAGFISTYYVLRDMFFLSLEFGEPP